jgi:predicted nucleotide-binding protein
VLDPHLLDRRKISALRTWGLIDEIDGRLKVTDEGRVIAKNPDGVSRVLKNIIRNVEPYNAVIERAAHTNEESMSTTDVAAYWHNHFVDEVAGSDEMLNEQAVCFFQVVNGAELGTLVVGRKGSRTRIDFNSKAINSFVKSIGHDTEADQADSVHLPDATKKHEATEIANIQPVHQEAREPEGVNRVFITHGKNFKILEQIKEIVKFGKLIPIVAEEHETLSKPVPEKVLDDMRSCDAAIIHVASEQVLIDEEGKPHHKINENVLIEIGAAMALYKHNFILLVEKGVQLPSNLQGLYECRYEGDKLDWESTMKLLKAFNEFR